MVALNPAVALPLARFDPTPRDMQVYYVPAGDAPLSTTGFVPLVASDADSVKYDHYDDYDACYVRSL